VVVAVGVTVTEVPVTLPIAGLIVRLLELLTAQVSIVD
jgi:hypothetical protein